MSERASWFGDTLSNKQDVNRSIIHFVIATSSTTLIKYLMATADSKVLWLFTFLTVIRACAPSDRVQSPSLIIIMMLRDKQDVNYY